MSSAADDDLDSLFLYPTPPCGSRRHFLPCATATPISVYLPVFAILLFLLAFFALYFVREPLLRRLHRLRRAAAGQPKSADRGLDPEILSSFPIFGYGDLRGGEKFGKECAVCLEEYGRKDGVRVLTVCCHAFHPKCIDPWLKEHATCPVCRSDLTNGGDGGFAGGHVINVDGSRV